MDPLRVQCRSSSRRWVEYSGTVLRCLSSVVWRRRSRKTRIVFAMHILVWNVAGWQPAAKQIWESFGSVKEWLERHRCDILALQEAKVRRSTLENDAYAAFASVDGYDSFWSPNKQTGSKSGLNGVATFARQGATSRADAEPLDDEKLDCEGRCLLTEHEGFVMLNVYVPASGSGRERLPHKHRFLRALKSRVKAEQERGNTPVVVGDFNIAYRPKDVHWRHRLVKLGLLEQHGDPPGGISAELHAKLKRMIGDVRRLLASMEVVHIPAKGSSKSSSSSVVGIYGQRSMDSYVARIKTDCGESVAIGKKFQSNDEAEMRLRLQRVVQADPDTREEFTAWPEDRLSIEHLAEVLKAMGTPLSEDSQRELADSLGETYGAPADVEWMHEFMAECCLHDAFADSHPGAVERFTAWDQYTNKRYENIGCRIDFTFVHSSLMPYIESGESLCGSCKSEVSKEEAALMAAVAKQESGLQYQPAPRDGGGISDAPMVLIENQFCEPHTGIVYTPPKWSDHVAVSLCLNDSFLSKCGWLTLQNDKPTRSSQPHRLNRSVKSMLVEGKGSKRARNEVEEPNKEDLASSKEQVKPGHSSKGQSRQGKGQMDLLTSLGRGRSS